MLKGRKTRRRSTVSGADGPEIHWVLGMPIVDRRGDMSVYRHSYIAS